MGRLKTWLSRRAGTALIAVALFGSGAYAVQMHEIDQREKCLSSYFQAYAAQSTARGAINVASDDAKTTLLLGVADSLAQKPTTDAKEKQRRSDALLGLFVDYRAATDKVAAQREATPLPRLPDC